MLETQSVESAIKMTTIKTCSNNGKRIEQMELNKTFFIVYYSNKDKKHITRQGKHDEKSRYGTSKKGVAYYVYYDLDAHGYRTASGSWKIRF
jgi:hypothetical protein